MVEISNMEMMIIKLNIKMLETEPAIEAEIWICYATLCMKFLFVCLLDCRINNFLG